MELQRLAVRAAGEARMDLQRVLKQLGAILSEFSAAEKHL